MLTAHATTTLREQALAVLHRNDVGSFTKPAPDLYPHQWSWDSAFVAVGLSHVDVERAAVELERLFAGQWASGRLPHIVFNPAVAAGHYFPDQTRWGCAGVPGAPAAPPYTSGIIQPPVHAIAARRILDAAVRAGTTIVDDVRAFLRALYPRLLRWHRYLATARDPEESGLVTIIHPWESGMDNSPRWDEPLASLDVGEVPPYQRVDLAHVADPGERPGKLDYDRFIWLVELLKRVRYDDARTIEQHPFQVKDVAFSAISVAANEALLEIAILLGRNPDELEEIRGWIRRGKRGLESTWDPQLGICVDIDARTGRPLRTRTVAGLTPLMVRDLAPHRRDALLRTLDSEGFAGHPRLEYPLPPSTSPVEDAFQPRNYWRGPIWPVVNWLLSWSLARSGLEERAAEVREASLEQIERCGFSEYVEPFTGEPLGSRDQSWTAAVTIDWLVAA